MKMNTGGDYCEDLVKSLLKHSKLIDRCFWPDNVQDIMENLRRETDPFAKVMLDRMEKNSMSSM